MAQQKPNIIIFYVDDMGFGDLSITGATGYTTPNIDNLANEGMFFTHYYASSAISTASRAGLMTGCYATRVGVPGVYMTDPTVGLNPNEEIIPELLSKQGYRTAMVGKWHLGMTPEFMPIAQGFDEFYGLPYSHDIWPVDYDGNPITEQSPFSRKMACPTLTLYEGTKPVKEIKTLDDAAQLTTLYTERAIRFIRENKKNPFLLFVTHNMPHVPLAASDKFKGKSQAGLYGDVMMELDWSVGEVMKSLKENDIDDNTLVIFTSDNGPWLTFGDHSGSAGSLREGKQCSFDGGQRVPCLMRWKGVIPEGVVNPQLISNLDILPTLAAITGAELPKAKIDGLNMLSLLKGNVSESPRKYFYYIYSMNPLKPMHSLEGIRDERFKLVFPHKYLTDSGQGVKIGKGGHPGVRQVAETTMALYDLRQDAGERRNVIDLYPEVVERLQAAAEKIRHELGDDLQGIEATEQRPGGEISNK
ncbi:MAG: sulfatase [Bacteroides sp.]|nr:sulfatase [Bacteroides sp.]